MNNMQRYLLDGAEELGIALSTAQVDMFAVYADELCRWNSKINLTSIVKPEEIAIKHFIDSVAIMKYVELESDLLDIGSGGGFPSIPIKIVAPEKQIISVDAVAKKIHFQRHVARTLGLDGFTALHCRAENLLSEKRYGFKSIISRAFTDILQFVKYALPLLTENGIIVAMKGKDGKSEAEAAFSELGKIGATVVSMHEFQLPIIKDIRSLIVIKKIAQ